VRTELAHFEAADGVGLAGLLFEPARSSRDAVVFLHGNGDSSVFYSARTLLLARELTRAGIAFFPFNNRGAHLVKQLKRRGRSITQGMAFELIRDAIPDIEGSARFLRERGYDRIHLVGHSTGANKIALYNAKRPRNRIASYVLLSGGDDSGLYLQKWGRRRFEARLQRAREMIRLHRGGEFVPESWGPFGRPFLMSWASLYDTINPDGDYNVFPFLELLSSQRVSRRPLFRHFRTITKRTLALYGERDEFCFDDVPACVELLRRYANNAALMKFEIMPGANHGYSGLEGRLGKRLAMWVRGD
jgi:pimeloyl-ACP methyl ester carboxylesterase